VRKLTDKIPIFLLSRILGKPAAAGECRLRPASFHQQRGDELMSTTTRTAAMVSLVAASLSCLAEPSAAATVKRNFNGSNASAQFYSYEECVETSTFISAFDNVENKLATLFYTLV
jgi:hypothetical protein